MTRSLLPALALLAVFSAAPLLGAKVQLEPVSSEDGGPVWAGKQFVAADKAGNVFFFRSETLEVYPLSKDGSLGAPVRLKTAGSPVGEVHDVALSPDGRRWLVQTIRGVRLFEAGKEKVLPALAWRPVAVGFRRDVPVVATIAIPVQSIPDPSKVGRLPWLQELSGDEWSTLVERDGPPFSELVKRENWFGEALEEDPLALAADRRGRLWVARRHAYNVQEFNPGGRLLSTILMDQGRVRKKKESQGIEIKRSDPAGNPREATRNPATEKATFYPFVAEKVIHDLVEGRDGRMYFLVVPRAGTAALDRFDPVRAVLERINIPLKADSGDFVAMAAGKDGLYFASTDPKQGRWMVTWEALDAAGWKEVEGATLDGLENAPPEPARGN